MTADFLQEHITKLQEWNKKWLLQFSEEKSEVMQLGRGYPACQYHMGNTPPSTTEAEKDPGVYVTRLPVKAKSVPSAADGLKGNILTLSTCSNLKVIRILEHFWLS